MDYETTIGLRYLRSKRKEAFISFTTWISVVGIAIGVMAIIVVIAVMTGFQDEIRARILGINPHILVLDVNGEIRNPGEVVAKVKKVDGVVEAFPFTAFGRMEGDLDFPFVDVDGVEGMRAIGEHLVGLGHRRIACLAPPADLLFTDHRLAGLREALAPHGLALPDDQIINGDLTQKSGFDAVEHLLSRSQAPTAIAACNDLMALGAMSAIQGRGLAVGKDIAVTGFDDIPMAEHSHPPLTTVHQPIYQIGKLVCDMLIHLLRGEALSSRQVILAPKLVVRHSCGSASKPAAA